MMNEEQTRAAFEAAMVAAGHPEHKLFNSRGAYTDLMDIRFNAFKLGLAHREPANYCPDCGKRNSADGVHTCSPHLREEVEKDAARYKMVRDMNLNRLHDELRSTTAHSGYDAELVDYVIDAHIAERENKPCDQAR